MDLILRNGRIHQIDEEKGVVEALAIREGKIEALGRDEEIMKLAKEDTEIIDLEGRPAFPGFNDSHMHLVNYGYSRIQADLIGVQSIDELKERMSNFIQDKGIEEGKWVLGRGWNHDYFLDKQVFPHRYDLDEISTEHPIMVTRTCGHVASINSKALEIIGIDRDTEQVEGGHFDLDEHGEPRGIFREKALFMVHENIPSFSLDEVKEMILLGVRALNSEGITSVGSDDFEALPDKDYEKIIQAYKALSKEGRLNIRVYQQGLFPDPDSYREFLDQGHRTGDGDNFFKIGPLKILLDGSLGARTAALEEDYQDDPGNRGILSSTKEELDQMVQLAHENNCQVAIHGIGDRAIGMALDSIGSALEKDPREDHRHGIVHSQITNEGIFQKFKDTDSIAYIQPIFLDYDWSMVEERIGKKRLETSYNWKRMVDMGIPCSLGSDAPVETFSVMAGIYEAVTRKDLRGEPEGGWMPDQALSVDQALAGYTLEGAYASFEEDIKGSLERGKLADIVVLEEDPYQVDEDRIKDIRIHMTIVNGKVVYD